MEVNEDILKRKDRVDIEEFLEQHKLELGDISCWIINLAFALSFLHNETVANVLPAVVLACSSLMRTSILSPDLPAIEEGLPFSIIRSEGNGLVFSFLVAPSMHWDQFTQEFMKSEFPVMFQQMDLSNKLLDSMAGYLENKETHVFLVPSNVRYEDGINPGHLSLFICHDGKFVCADFHDIPFELSIEDIKSRMMTDALGMVPTSAINIQEGQGNDLYINFGFPWIEVKLPESE